MAYNNPTVTNEQSDIGEQIRTDLFARKALDRLKNERHFTALGVSKDLPKHMGKSIKQFVYYPILSDENINSLGIDGSDSGTDFIRYVGGAGAIIDNKWTVWNSLTRVPLTTTADSRPADTFMGTIVGASQTKTIASDTKGTDIVMTAAGTNNETTQDWTVTMDGVVIASGLNRSQAALVKTPVIVKQNSGNLYGGTRDTNLITDKLPKLNEFGGWKNRVGMKRKIITGSVFLNGYYLPLTKEGLDFDNDSELLERSINEVLETAHEITEDLIQSDLVNAATTKGTVFFAGSALTKGEVTSGLSYNGLMKWGLALSKNRVPKKTTVVTGSRLTDTETIDGGWLAYISEDMIPTFMAMKDYHDERAWVPARKYAAASNLLPGEAGSIGPFRFIVNQQMQTSTNNAGEEIQSILVVGEESFASINFMGNSTNGAKGSKGRYTTQFVKPGSEEAKLLEPFAQTGFFSINWYHGFMTLRNERLGIFWTKAEIDNT